MWGPPGHSIEPQARIDATASSKPAGATERLSAGGDPAAPHAVKQADLAVSNHQAALHAWFARTFRSLSYRDYRFYFTGQLISLSGTWMQALALNWLVYKLTRSAWMLGLLSFCGLFPALLLGLAGGWLADRVDRRKLLLCTQVLAMLQASVLAFLTLSGRIEIWQIVALAACLGVVNAFDMPARQAFTVNLVERSELVNAVSLNSSLFHASRTIGPALGAMLVGWVGEGICFALNAVSYLGAVAAIALIRRRATDGHGTTAQRSRSVFEALRFVFFTRGVRAVLLLSAVTAIFGMQYLVLMPVFAAEVLRGDVGALGVLTAGAGTGACAGALLLAGQATGERLERGVGYASVGFALALIAFSLSSNLLLSACLTFAVGFFITIQLSGSHSLLQLAVSDELRGRVMSVWMINMLGMVPLGSLIVGASAHRLGAPLTLLACGAICAAAGGSYILWHKNSKRGGAHSVRR